LNLLLLLFFFFKSLSIKNKTLNTQALEYSVTQQCKCHGVSGSCNIKTCWHALTKVQELALRLKKSYSEATQVAIHRPINKRHRLHRFKFQSQLQPTSPDNVQFGGDNLVFVTASPDYCDADAQFGTFGTRGRLEFISLIFSHSKKITLLLTL
jgi:wnt family